MRSQELTMVRSLEATRWKTIPSSAETVSARSVAPAQAKKAKTKPGFFRAIAEDYYTVIVSSFRDAR